MPNPQGGNQFVKETPYGARKMLDDLDEELRPRRIRHTNPERRAGLHPHPLLIDI